jgi:BirA family biotin operon repressor/biotin-[acetyl-CoA-carboxylase] ligase
MDAARTRIQQGVVRLEAGVPTPFVGILAYEQTAGRGQRGRVWNSRPGASLCATFYFRHGLDLPEEIGMVALLAGVATAAVLHSEAVHGNSVADIGLKWPNDILIDGKKAGGILVETVLTPQGQTVALIGIGINLAAGAFPPELASRAASLESAGIVVRNPIVLAANVADALQAQAQQFCQEGRAGLTARWRALDRTTGRRYHTDSASGPTAGIAEGIDDDGRLLLRLPDGSLFAVGSASTLQETVS